LPQQKTDDQQEFVFAPAKTRRRPRRKPQQGEAAGRGWHPQVLKGNRPAAAAAAGEAPSPQARARRKRAAGNTAATLCRPPVFCWGKLPLSPGD